MNPLAIIIRKMFIRRFYAQQAALFLFLFTVMVAIIETITGDKQAVFTYHYHLILGMLGSYEMLGVVLFLWLVYCFQCVRFVLTALSVPNASFLETVNRLTEKEIFLALVLLHIVLYLPVLLYAVVVIVIALVKQLYLKAILIVLFNTILCVVSARAYRQKLQYAGLPDSFLSRFRTGWPVSKPYFYFLLLHLFARLRFLYAGIKIFSGILLYAFLRNLGQDDYDLRLMMLLFSMALMGLGVIIHKTRTVEETQMAFYRQLPVPLWKRGIQYLIFYTLILIPEIIIVAGFVPLPLHTKDAVYILLFALSFLLLMHAVLAASIMPMKSFLKICFTIFSISYFFIISNTYPLLILLLFTSSAIIFISQYHRFELNTNGS